MSIIDENTSVEEIVDNCPAAVDYLRKNNIVCIVCGEPVWGSIGELMSSKNIDSSDYISILEGLNKLCSELI